MRTALLVLAFCSLMLSACRGTDPAILEDPNYRLGYGDGCSTANSRVRSGHNKVYRNNTLFKEDKNYQLGWRDGYVGCGDRQNPDGFGLD